MRIALFGGSFDPPHCGHIGIALAARERLDLDCVLMAPVGRQPLKLDLVQSSYQDRLAMVRLACTGYPALQPSEIEAPAADGRLSYTCETLLTLRSTLTADDELYCLIGADSLRTLHHWHRAAEAMFLAEWVVAGRPGSGFAELASLLPAGVLAGQPEHQQGRVRIPLTSEKAPAARGVLWLLPDLHYDVSATELRAALADHSAGVPQRILAPEVADYARAHQLYSRSTSHSSL